MRRQDRSPTGRVTLDLDKPQYFLGENVLVHVCLENAGDKPFSYSYGSDDEAASRSLRFKVTAVGPHGRPVADPDPSGFCLGGVGGSGVLEPGKHHYWSLPLIRYCRLDEPGTYTLYIHHDFGWTETPQRKYPVGMIHITLVMPNPAQARQVLEEMDAPPSKDVREWGEKAAPYPDFSALRYPVYLPLLKDRAQTQDQKTYATALQGIGSIPTPDATEALLDLANDPDLNRALLAVQTLNARLPDPTLQGKLIHRGPFADPTTSARLYLSQSAWRSKFAPRARALAHRLLNSLYVPAVTDAAFILECVGADEDFSDLTSALNTAIQQTPAVPVGGGSYPRVYGACTELERATLARIQEGTHVSAAPRSLAEQDEYLQALTAQPQRPSDWPAQCLTMLDSPSAYIRARTLATLASISPLPTSVMTALRERLPAFLLDPNEDVQVGACDLAMQIKDPSLRAPVLQAMTQALDFPLPDNLTIAATVQGARWEALKFWADHLDDPARKMNALEFVQVILNEGRSGGCDSNYDAATATALKAAWAKFLVAHRQEIESGKTYPLDTPEMQTLFPRSIYTFGGGSF